MRARWVMLVLAIGCVSLQLGPITAEADFFEIHDIKPGLPPDPPYGQVVREIRIEGNKKTREDVIRRALKTQVGYVYTEENAEKDLTWVMRLGSLTEVSFDTEPVEDGIALICKVNELTPWMPSVSLKITQENGVEIGPAFSSYNLFGTAARMNAFVRFGGATNFGVKYADPQIPTRNWLYGYKISYEHNERPNELLHFQETSDEVFVEIGQPAGDFMRAGLRFRYLGLTADRDSMTLSPDNRDQIPSLSFYVRQDSRNGIYPTDGWYLELEAGKYGIFGGDGDFWRLDVDVRRYRALSFIGPRHSVALSFFTTLMSGEVGKTIPPHQAFFVGGTNSVRGWALGSRVGQNQWLNTAEYWFRLMDRKRWKAWFIKWSMGFQIGVFGDLGTAWSDYEDLESNMIAGGGVGFRLTLPLVTLLRFDLAYGEHGESIRVAIGGAEKADAQKNRVR